MSEVLPIIAYFIIYSFIGWGLESIYKSILQKRMVNSGFLHGPFCPIYGYGAMIMYLSLRNLTNNLVILFSYGIVVLSLFEYIVGIFLEIVFKTKYWDYSKKRFNIHGRVCLQNSIYWGILGVIFMTVIHPLIEKLYNTIPVQYSIVIVSLAIIGIFIDTVITIIGLVKINIKLKNLEEISNIIRSKIDSISERNIENIRKLREMKFINLNSGIKNNENILEELKKKQQHYKELLEKRIARLRRAFPSMKSERITKFLNNDKKS